MKVIARNNGSYKQDAYFNIVREGLIQGKEYTVVKWSYQDNSIALGHWVNRTDNFSNPSKTKFYITIMNNGKEEAYWNDYFLSAEEMRDYKLNNIGIVLV